MDISLLTDSIMEIAIRVLLISFSALGVVYMLSRMLFIPLNPRGKNIVAIISIFTLSFIFVFGNITYSLEHEVQGISSIDDKVMVDILISWIFHSFISIVFYVLLGFRLYGRVDWLLDRKIGKDSIPDEVKKYEEKINKKRGRK